MPMLYRDRSPYEVSLLLTAVSARRMASSATSWIRAARRVAAQSGLY